MDKNIEVIYHFTEVVPHVEESIKKYVEENITKKMDAYFKKVLSHADARITLRITIAKHKGDDDRYD